MTVGDAFPGTIGGDDIAPDPRGLGPGNPPVERDLRGERMAAVLLDL